MSEIEIKHQILSLRPFFNDIKGIWDVTDTRLVSKNLGFTNFLEILKDPKKPLSKLPKSEHWNLFYTVAQCAGKREFVRQKILVFDLDKIDMAQPKKYIAIVKEVLGSGFAVIDSGNGLHFVFHLKTPITETIFFDTNRRHYNAICEKLNHAISRAGLPGVADPTVFDPRRIMRYPETENRKEGKDTKHAHVISHKGFEPRDFNFVDISGLPDVAAVDQIQPRTAKQIPTDGPAVLAGCEFIKWCKANPKNVSEAQWYAALSVLGRIDRKTAHEYSQGHPTYSHAETESKIDQALEASGPRTCKGVAKLGFNCAGCVHYGKLESPIMIRGSGFIKTRESGFHSIIQGEHGPKPGKPCYDDLRLFFAEKHPYIIASDALSCFIWTGQYWEYMQDSYIERFAQTHFKPTATNGMAAEFKGLILRTNSREPKWFSDTTQKKMNFRNGVLDLETLELSPHSQEYGFRYVLDYDYDPKALAPAWEKFLDFVTQGRKDLQDILIEYMGYAFSGDECWATKCLILTGDGSNGKSTFVETLQRLAGEKTCTSLSITELAKAENRFRIDGVLFNISEETPTHAMVDSGLFKALIGGTKISGRQYYKQSYDFKNHCKLILLCNSLPVTFDVSYGYFRRLLIVPFDRKIEDSEKDSFIKVQLFKELPGIFNHVIIGYRRLMAQKDFTKSATVSEAIAQYKDDSDGVARWYNEVVYEDETRACNLKDMYPDFNEAMEREGFKKIPEFPEFRRRMRQLIPNYKDRVKDVIRINGKLCRPIKGITWRKD